MSMKILTTMKEEVLVDFTYLIYNLMERITGMNPKASFGNRFGSKLRDIKPSTARDNSTYASNFTSFVFSESH